LLCVLTHWALDGWSG